MLPFSSKEKIAYIISRVLGPESTMPFIMWVLVTYFSDFDWKRAQFTVLLSFFFFIVVPTSLFIAFYILGYLSDVDATLRKQRPPVLFAKQISFAVGLYFVYASGTPQYIQLMVWWFLISATEFIISLFWKVSIHMTAATMIVLTCGILFGNAFLWLWLVLPVIAWSRTILKKHDPLQLIVGTVIPVLWWALLSLTYSIV